MVSIRHPLAAAHFHYTRQGLDETSILYQTCGANYIRHWLHLYKVFLEDLQQGLDPGRVLIVPFEHLFGYGLSSSEAGQERMRRLVDKMYNFLGLEPGEYLEFSDPEPRGGLIPTGGNLFSTLGADWMSDIKRVATNDDRASQEINNDPGYSTSKTSGENFGVRGNDEDRLGGNGFGAANLLAPSNLRRRRRLLGYHGDKGHVTVQWEVPLSWIPDFVSRVNVESAACKSLIAECEDKLRFFGYSLANLTLVTQPSFAVPHMLWED